LRKTSDSSIWPVRSYVSFPLRTTYNTDSYANRYWPSSSSLALALRVPLTRYTRR
jgi:hypothetical protein